jgi:hypothetical protein
MLLPIVALAKKLPIAVLVLVLLLAIVQALRIDLLFFRTELV